MATILVFNNSSNAMERYVLSEWQPMPYNTGGTLTVGEFRGSSRSSLLYTDVRTMNTWNSFRRYYNKPIHVGYAFKRIWEGGHGAQSQHYAGTSFDTGQNLSSAGRSELRNSAIKYGGWGYVEPASLTPTWVHFDRRAVPGACGTLSGYPLVRNGSRGNYVLVLQDALNALGYTTGGLDGIFGNATTFSVIAFQKIYGLAADGVVGCNTWNRLAASAVGIGHTPTVLYP